MSRSSTVYSWIIFDADGTLFDFERAEWSAFNRTMNDFGVDVSPEIYDAYRTISIDIWARFERGELSSQRLRVERFEQLLGQFGLAPRPTDVSAHYIESLGTEHGLLPESESVIETLAADFKLLLATNGIADVQRKRFAGSSIYHFFAHVLISDEIGVAKPDPRYFEEAFAQMGGPARSEVLMVGDGLSSDIAGGAGYGIDTCWFNPGNESNGSAPQPTYEIRRLRDLYPIVNRGQGGRNP